MLCLCGGGPRRLGSRRAGSRPAGRVDRQQERQARRLGEVEVSQKVAESWLGLTDVRTVIRSAVGPRIEPGSAEEIALDEPDIRVERQHLMVDVSAARVRADHETGNPEPV